MSMDGNLSGEGYMEEGWKSFGEFVNPGAERICVILPNRDSKRRQLPGIVVLVVWNGHSQGKNAMFK